MVAYASVRLADLDYNTANRFASRCGIRTYPE